MHANQQHISTLVGEEKASKTLNVAQQTLRNWRSARKGPPYIKLGRAIRYNLRDLIEFVQSKRIDPEGKNDY